MGMQEDIESIIAEAGETLSWYANTESFSAESGDRLSSFAGSPTSIKGMITGVEQVTAYFPEGIRAEANTGMLASPDYAISENDKITWSGVDYVVVQVSLTAHFAGTNVFRAYTLKKVASEEP